MPHCTKCGTPVAESAAFCPNCGQATGVQSSGAGPAAQSGLSENGAATFSYVLGWLTGLIFFLIDKRPYVRFHAVQSIVVFGALHLLSTVLGYFLGVSFFYGGWAGFGIGSLLSGLLSLLTLVLWIVCMVKAYQGERFKVPIAADIAENFAGR